MKIALSWVAASLLLAAPLPGRAQAPAWRAAEDSRLGFTATQQGAPFDGEFETFRAQVRFSANDLEGSRFTVTVDVASVDTQNAERDETLRGAEFFWADRWPQARFEASEFRRVNDSDYEALGKLTIRDQTHSLTLPFTFSSAGSTAELSGKVSISRLRYGVGQGDWADTRWIGDQVEVSYRLQLSRP
jgi:polyisoprenoid-binding protein YceI